MLDGAVPDTAFEGTGGSLLKIGRALFALAIVRLKPVPLLSVIGGCPKGIALGSLKDERGCGAVIIPDSLDEKERVFSEME
jgi:hypothetical protein